MGEAVATEAPISYVSYWKARELRRRVDQVSQFALELEGASIPRQLTPIRPHTDSTEMFFTPELLSRRDSGIGLLWSAQASSCAFTASHRVCRLAATLGSKSAFTKLQKRDVMTANISQLCTLVAQPAEPLALRLSSNLMVGVVR